MLKFAKETLTEAGNLFGSYSTQIVTHKVGSGNYATKMDYAINEFITNKIHAAFPAHTILSEESILPSVSKETNDLWIVDPLDGTTNATYGVPHYGISLAFMHKGEVVIGVILDVPNNIVYWAEKGQGAFFQNRLSAQPVALHIREGGLADSLVCTGAPYARKDFATNWMLMDKVHAAGARLLILGSAIIASCYVAEGKLSLYYEVGLKPWDIAAASLIVQEAGGIATAFGGDLDILAPQTFLCGGSTAIDEFRQLTTRSA